MIFEVFEVVEMEVVITGDTEVCQGDEVSLAATVTNGGTAPVYQWYLNEMVVGDNTAGYSFYPAQGDEVKLQVTSGQDICVTDTLVYSNTLVFQVVETIIPTAVINAEPTVVCEGEERGFTATVSGAGNVPIFQWLVNGEAMGISEPVLNYEPDHGDAVQLILNSTANCATPATVESNIVEAVVYALPEVSWETFKPDTFCIFWDAVAISGGLPEGGEYSGPGVLDNSFDPEEAGIGEHELTYSYTTDQGCTAQTSHIVFVDYCTGLSQSDESKQTIRIYPNPASHTLHLDLKETTGECQTITIYNSLGIAMHRMINPAKQKHTITLSNWPEGIYHIRFDLDSDMINKQFLISK